MGVIVPPLGGGASENDRIVMCDDHGCLMRVQPLVDLIRIRASWGTYFPLHCPACTRGHLQEPGAQSHTFDYVVRDAAGKFFAVCCNCGGDFELHGTVDRTEGTSVTNPQATAIWLKTHQYPVGEVRWGNA